MTPSALPDPSPTRPPLDWLFDAAVALMVPSFWMCHLDPRHRLSNSRSSLGPGVVDRPVAGVRDTTVTLIDDLDGSVTEDIQTVTFSHDGKIYEVDLGAENRQRLEEALAPFKTVRRRPSCTEPTALKRELERRGDS